MEYFILYTDTQIPKHMFYVLWCKTLVWMKKNSKLNEGFIKSYNEDSKIGYLLEVDVQYPKQLHKLHIYLFSLEKIKTKKCEKNLCNLHGKREYVEKEKTKTLKNKQLNQG